LSSAIVDFFRKYFRLGNSYQGEYNTGKGEFHEQASACSDREPLQIRFRDHASEVLLHHSRRGLHGIRHHHREFGIRVN